MGKEVDITIASVVRVDNDYSEKIPADMMTKSQPLAKFNHSLNLIGQSETGAEGLRGLNW